MYGLARAVRLFALVNSYFETDVCYIGVCMRIGIILAVSVAALPAFGQYQYDLATTRDGSLLYFSSIDPATSLNAKIYRWSQAAGVTLFGDRPDLAQLPPHFGQHLYGAEITDAGSVLYHAEPLCVTGMGPGFNDCTIGETQIVTPSLSPFSLAGFLLISPNGRYGVFTPYGSGAMWVDWFTGEEIEVDFHQYEVIPGVTPPFSVNQHAVADNGSFLMTASGSDGLKVWTKAGEILLPVTDIARNAAISADGSTVAVTSRDLNSADPTIPTYVYDLSSGQRTRFPHPVSMSDDGQTVAYLSADIVSWENAQAIVAHGDGTSARQITNLPEGIRSLLLSGDARYLYVVVGNPYFFAASRIQRYELATGAVEQIPAVP